MKLLLEKFGGFLQAVGRSCYDMEFYRTVRVRPPMRAVLHFAAFAALLAALGAAIFGPSAFVAVGQIKTWTGSHLADGATFTLSGGKLSTNIAEPTDFGTEEKFILDTGVQGGSFPEDRYPKADVVIGRDAVFLRKDANELRTYLFGEYPDFSVSKEEMISWLDRYGMLAAAGLVVSSALLYWLFFMFGMAFYVMAMSVLALMAGKIWKVGLDYGQWTAVGFHALTLPVLVNIVLDTLGMSIPYSFSFIYVLFIGAVIADERSSPVGPVVREAPAPLPPPPAVAAPAAKPPKEKKIAAKPRKPSKKSDQEPKS